MIQMTTIGSTLALATLMTAAALYASPIDSHQHSHPQAAAAVHQAEHSVDRAWETYHKAALGGTISSPALQADIEEHLHEARGLVTRAHRAAEEGDQDLVKALVEQIDAHTRQAIQESLEPKP